MQRTICLRVFRSLKKQEAVSTCRLPHASFNTHGVTFLTTQVALLEISHNPPNDPTLPQSMAVSLTGFQGANNANARRFSAFCPVQH